MRKSWAPRLVLSIAIGLCLTACGEDEDTRTAPASLVGRFEATLTLEADASGLWALEFSEDGRMTTVAPFAKISNSYSLKDDELTVGPDDLECRVGGTYRVTLEANELTLQELDDGCDVRVPALTQRPWRRAP